MPFGRSLWGRNKWGYADMELTRQDMVGLRESIVKALTLARQFADGARLSDTATKVLMTAVQNVIGMEDALSRPLGKKNKEAIGISDSVEMVADSPGMVRLYDLLPRVYQERDTQNYLKNFLWGFQEELGKIYRDEKVLRTIQGISSAPSAYLPYIARSLGWRLHNKDYAARRNECASIADYYDLKGTPYGIRLLSHLTLDRLFRRLMEFYPPSAASASTIITTPNDDLAALLDSEGSFVDPSWGTYHYDPLYSYAIEMRVDPNNYAYGEIRPRIKAFKNRIHTMHPAGRYCYPYIYCRGTRASHYKQVQFVYEEITGLKTYDDLGSFDDGGRLDEDDEPVDQSLSTKFYKDWKAFDDDGTLDDNGYLDDGFWEVHGIFEIN